MNPYHGILLLAFVAVAAALLIRFVQLSVDREFRNLARAVSDQEYRDDELAKVDRTLSAILPLPADVGPMPKPAGGGARALPSILLALGVILLWGALFARHGGALWLYAGLGATLLAALLLFAGLRRRKWERAARLLRFRADLRRLGGDRDAAAADLRELLKLTPWDDAAWAELADDLAARGDLDDALDAVRQAARLDPVYDEYRMMEASLSIRSGRLDEARSAIRIWADLDGVEADDPRLVAYRAAVDLAAGKKSEAESALRGILRDPDVAAHEFLDADQALHNIRDLLPGKD